MKHIEEFKKAFRNFSAYEDMTIRKGLSDDEVFELSGSQFKQERTNNVYRYFAATKFGGLSERVEKLEEALSFAIDYMELNGLDTSKLKEVLHRG